MIIGKFVLGRYAPDKECTLIESRKIAKIEAYIAKYRLTPEAERRLIELCCQEATDAWEKLFKRYINDYYLLDVNVCCFLENVQHNNLIKLWLISEPLHVLSDDTLLFVLKHFYEMFLAVDIDSIYRDNFFGITYRYVKQRNKSVWNSFIEYVTCSGSRKIVHLALTYSEDIKLSQSEDFVYMLKHYSVKQCANYFRKIYMPEDWYIYAEDNFEFVRELFKIDGAYVFSTHQKLLTFFNKYPDCVKSVDEIVDKLTFHEGKAYLSADERMAFLRVKPQMLFSYDSLTEDEESILFEEGNENFLLQYATNVNFVSQGHHRRFLLLVAKYPNEVKKYVKAYEQKTDLSDEERNTLLKLNINQIFDLNKYSKEDEALLFEADNIQTLLSYVEQKRFVYAENEFNFLLMVSTHHDEVLAYVVKYGYDINLNSQQLQRLQNECFELLSYVKIQLSEVKDKMLPVWRRCPSKTKLVENEVEYLIDLSWEYPQLLAEYIEHNHCGGWSDRLIAKLFFCGNWQLADKYLKDTTGDTLIKYADVYGATAAEIKSLKRDSKIVANYEWTVGQLGHKLLDANIWDEFMKICLNSNRNSDYCGCSRCQIRDCFRQKSLCPEVKRAMYKHKEYINEVFFNINSLLEAIARRNRLLQTAV